MFSKERFWIGFFRKQVHGVTYPSCNVRFLSSYSLNTYTCSSFKTPKYLDAYIMLVKTSWLKEWGCLVGPCARKLELLGILLQNQGRSQAVSFSFWRQPGRIGAATVCSQDLTAEYLVILRFWNQKYHVLWGQHDSSTSFSQSPLHASPPTHKNPKK